MMNDCYCCGDSFVINYVVVCHMFFFHRRRRVPSLIIWSSAFFTIHVCVSCLLAIHWHLLIVAGNFACFFFFFG